MKIIITILCIYSFAFSQPNIKLQNPDDFYSVSSLYMSILKLDEGELVFYGGDGGILRTYDNGKSWEQNYSGTKSYIPKMQFHNGVIYGVTFDGKFMKSTDKGEYWEYRKLSNAFNDLTVFKNSIYLSTLSDTIYVSGDDGKTWSFYKINTDSILSISSFENKLIVNTKSGKLFYSNDIKDDFKLLNKPMNSFFVNNKYEDFYIYSNSQIAKLKSDLTWELYDLSSLNRRFKFVPNDNHFAIFSAKRNIRSELGLETYIFDRTTRDLKFINKFRNELLNSNDQIYNQEYEPFDVEYSDGLYFSSNYYKTILTTKNLIEWDININCNIMYSDIGNVFDQNNMLFSKIGNAEFIKSTDGGRTFKIQQEIPYDTLDNKELVPKMDNFYFKNHNNGLLKLHYNGYFDNGSESLFSKNYIEVINGNYNDLEIDFPNIIESGYIKHERILTNIEGKYLIEIGNKINKKVANQDGTYSDSLFLYRYYSYNDNKLDTLFFLKRPIIFQNKLSTVNKIYFTGNIDYNDSVNTGKTILYSMNDFFNNIKIEHIFDETIQYNGIYKDNLNDLIVINGSSIHLYDIEYNLDRVIETELEHIEVYGEYKGINNTYFSSGKPYNDTINGVVFKRFKPFLFYFDESYEIIEVELDWNFIYFKNSVFNNEFSYYFENRGLFQVLNIPIEEDKKAYYLSVEKPRPPSFWTYPPFPNPANDRIKMKFYSGMMHNIDNLKVELVEISSGRVYNIKDYNISITDDYFGEIEIKLGQFNRGAYLINYKLGEANKSEPLIIK